MTGIALILWIKYILALFCLNTFGKLSYWKTKLIHGYGNEETAPVLYITGRWTYNLGKRLKIKRYFSEQELNTSDR